MPQNKNIEAGFWAFSLDRYARPGVGELCIELQETTGADVNIILMCLWVAQSGRQLTPTTLKQMLSGDISAWHREAVVPLRAARRSIKVWNTGKDDPQVNALRDKIKALEIEAERQQQRFLAQAVARHFETTELHRIDAATPAILAIENLTGYFEVLTPNHQPFPHGQLKSLVEKCID